MHAPHSTLNWQPDPYQPTGSRVTLQEFVCHSTHHGLRIILEQDAKAILEVDGVPAGITQGFDNAAALGSLYLQHGCRILADARGDARYRLDADGSGFAVVEGESVAMLLGNTHSTRQLAHAPGAIAALMAAQQLISSPLQPAFLDHRAIFVHVAPGSWHGLLCAGDIARHRLSFTATVADHGALLFSYQLARSMEGSLYSIYRLATGSYLAEVRSRHEASTIGSFDTPAAAIAWCTLVNAARHAGPGVALLHHEPADHFQSPDGAFRALRAAGGQVALFDAAGTPVGNFPTLALAASFATLARASCSPPATA